MVPKPGKLWKNYLRIQWICLICDSSVDKDRNGCWCFLWPHVLCDGGSHDGFWVTVQLIFANLLILSQPVCDVFHGDVVVAEACMHPCSIQVKVCGKSEIPVWINPGCAKCGPVTLGEMGASLACIYLMDCSTDWLWILLCMICLCCG